MASVIDAPVGELTDPKIRAVVTRAVREFELAAEKVAANAADPKAFPLPADQKSTEQILAGRFQRLPKEAKTRASASALARVKASHAVRGKRFRDLAAVDLRRPTSIEDQVRALPFPAELKMKKEQLVAASGLPEVAAVEAAVQEAAAELTESPVSAAITTTKAELRIHRVRCLDETGGFFAEKLGADEIDLGGTEVDESGDTRKISAFRVGSFDDGEQRVFSPPRRLTFFNLTEGTAFPKSYFVSMVLAEIDMGGLPDFLNQLLNKVKDRVITALTAAIGTAIGASGGLVGMVIGLAVGWAVGKVWEFFHSVWNDDVFEPVTVRLTMPSLTARWTGGRTDSPERTVTFSGHDGKYELTYDWRLFA
jgi:hypothetical protein